MKYDMKALAHDFWYGKPHQERRLGDLYIDKTGLYKHREWRGFKDTMYYFYNIWMYNYAHMVMDVVRYGGLINFAKGVWRYRWVGQTYLPVLHWFDRGMEGMRGEGLKASAWHYRGMVNATIFQFQRMFSSDANLRGGKRNYRWHHNVAHNETVWGGVFYPWHGKLTNVPMEMIPYFVTCHVNSHTVLNYIDAVQSIGLPGDPCPMCQAEAGLFVLDDMPDYAPIVVTSNEACDASVATSILQDWFLDKPLFAMPQPMQFDDPLLKKHCRDEIEQCWKFIEEQTGETFDWDAFFRAMKVYNQETEYELQKWEVNRTPYPQMTGETFWIYRMFFYHLSGGMDPHFLDTDRRVNRIMMRGYQQKKPCAPAMRHRCVEWSCPANFYPDFSVWAENCWGINVVASMESLISDIIINTEDPDQALADLARSYQRTTMRKHTKGGYANVLDELWIVCKQYNADMVLMYDQISCKGMDGLRGVFEEQAAARGVHMLWVAQDLLDSRTISKRDMRRQVNLYMQTVMGEEPVRPDLVDFDDALTW